MLWNIIEAYNGSLPDDIIVVFTNTGLEHHETYEFIHRIEENWCPIVWLEYDLASITKEIQRKDGLDVVTIQRLTHKIVDYHTASRNGEPFTKMIKRKKYLPNPVARICTENLKIKTMESYIEWDDYSKALGLRFDEPRRVSRMRNKSDVVMPMADAEHTQHDVRDFWSTQDIDLKLPAIGNIYSNCVGCFLKGYKSLEEIARSQPQYFDWWIQMESETGNVFSKDRPNYSKIKADAHLQLAFDLGDAVDCFCTN